MQVRQITLVDDQRADHPFSPPGSVSNPVRQTLQFVPTASFDRSNEAVSTLVSKVQGLLKNKDWDQFAAAHFVEVTNELRRMSKVNLEAFKSNADLK